MKPLTFALALSVMIQYSFAQYNNPSQTVYQKLAGVNKEWLKTASEPSLQRHTTFSTDEALIQYHLQQVEARLRGANTNALSASQRANRAMCLDYLHSYWQTGVFPKNTRHSIRTPYFIDDFGTYCAVGHLLQQSGYEQFAQRIHDENNYAYIHEMDYPELLAWADEYGFSVDELAWIQPAYSTPPPYAYQPVEGSDVTGTVNTIVPNETNDVLYVAAEFGSAGNGIMSFDGTTWDNMDGGVDGTVAVVLVDGQDVFVGGDFATAGVMEAHSVAKWSGSEWSALGSGLDGQVHALTFFNDELYAGGNLVFSGNLRSLAKWNGSTWTEVPDAPQGVVYALKEYKKALYAGGDFTTAGAERNLVKMHENGFEEIGGYATVVRALEVFQGMYLDTAAVLFIGGDIEQNDTTYEMFGFSQWNGMQMQNMISPFSWYTLDDVAFVSTLRVQNDRLFVTGHNFSYAPMYGFSGTSAVVFSKEGTDSLNGGLASGANGKIQAALQFKGAIILGGDFDTLSGSPVNKLALTGDLQTGIRETETFANTRVVYQQSNTVIYLDEQNTQNVIFSLYDATGKLVMNVNGINDKRVELSNNSLAHGLYLFSFHAPGKKLGAGRIMLR